MLTTSDGMEMNVDISSLGINIYKQSINNNCNVLGTLIKVLLEFETIVQVFETNTLISFIQSVFDIKYINNIFSCFSCSDQKE